MHLLDQNSAAKRTCAHRGVSVIESLLAAALLSFVILSGLSLQTISLSRLARTQHKLSAYSALLGWQPADLSSADCVRQSLPEGASLISCRRENPALNAGTTHHFLLP